MNTNCHEPVAPENSRFSTSAMLFWATLGTKTPAERRYRQRLCLTAFLLFGWVASAFAIHFRPRPLIGSLTALLIGAAITYMAWELRLYLLKLDELARQVQFEAMAWTYLTGFVLAGWLGTLAVLSYKLLHWNYKPELFLLTPFLYFFLEIFRGEWLHRLARRY